MMSDEQIGMMWLNVMRDPRITQNDWMTFARAIEQATIAECVKKLREDEFFKAEDLTEWQWDAAADWLESEMKNAKR